MPTTFEWETYDRWCKELGSDIIHLEVAGTSIVVMNSAEVAEELLDQHSAIHSDRPRLVMVNELMGWNFSFGLMAYGARNGNYFNRNSIPKPRNAFNLSRTPKIMYITSDTWQPQLSLELPTELMSKKTMTPTSTLLNSIPALKYIPEWFPGAGFKRKAREWARYSTIMRELPYAAAKKQILQGTARPSFTSYSLEKLAEGEEDVAEQEQRVQSTAATMYTGATDSTVSVLSTFILAMLANPEALKRAQEEIDSVVQSGEFPRFSDQERLPYVTAIVKETMRWKNVTPLGIPHASTSEDLYRGYRIPAGSIMVPNIWAILHDENTYPEPHTFKPERFIGEDGKINPAVKDPDTALFGFGRRICPGRFMAFSSIWIAVASMLAVFDISKPVDEDGNVIEPTFEYIPSMACVPAPFECALKPRSAQAEEMIRSMASEHS
ncbi:cytochrome p450 [Lentinula edodes]|uniref:Cytochrome p450 n=1 Tax=Lentinula edodes TaxID=5353 RepID=A0A1Q3EK47_LENED|nr:cytochrome p450 [Lentinula edodes]